MHTTPNISTTKNRRYKLGKVTFGSKLAKDHWILQTNIMAMDTILKLDKNNLTPTQKALVKLSIKDLKAMERRFKKQLIKDGYIIT